MWELILIKAGLWLIGGTITLATAVTKAIGDWALIKAVEKGNLALVRFWLRLTDVDAKDREARTALFLACERKDQAIAQCLLAHGASPNIPPVPIFVATHDGKTELVQLLVKHRALLNLTAPDDQGISKSLLVAAILAGDVGIIEILLKGGARADEADAMSLAIQKDVRKL